MAIKYEGVSVDDGVAALLLAFFLHRPPALVEAVYLAGGIDAVAVVEMESQFNPSAWRREPGGSSWGLFQLYDRHHDQHREDLLLHIVAGAAFLEECKKEVMQTEWIYVRRLRPVGGIRMVTPMPGPTVVPATSGVAAPRARKTASFADAVAHYNGGTYPGAYSVAWGKRVEAKRDELRRWLDWMEVRAMETAR